MLVNREVILAKVETTYNTDPTPVAGTDAILVESPSWALDKLRMVDRPVVKANLSSDQAIYAGALRKISFTTEVKGSGAAGTPPEIAPLLRACSMSEDIVASTSVTYKPVSTGQESVTIYYYQDGVLYKVTGCRGVVSFSLEAGGVMKATFEFIGHSAAPTTVALPTATYDSTVPVPLIGLSSMAVNSYAASIAALAFELGNNIATPADITQSDGYGEVLITKRKVTGSIDPLHTIIATQDWEGILRAGTLFAINTGVIGSVAGNRIQCVFDACYYMNLTPKDREGVRALDAPFGCVENAGEDEVEIIFT